MGRALQLCCSLALLAVGVASANAQKAPKEPPPPPAKTAKPAPAPKGGQPKPLPKGSGRLINPTTVVTRLYRMTPEQREQVIEKWDPKQQEQVRKNLAQFDSLPKEQQEIQLRRIDRFEQLPMEKRAEVAALLKAANQLPPERRNAIGRELYRLQLMPDRQRENVLARSQFKERFSPEEYRIISGLADMWMGPQQ